jgi:hypothetical protein
LTIRITAGPISAHLTACAGIFSSIAALPTSPFNAAATCRLIANSHLEVFLVRLFSRYRALALRRLRRTSPISESRRLGRPLGLVQTRFLNWNAVAACDSQSHSHPCSARGVIGQKFHVAPQEINRRIKGGDLFPSSRVVEPALVARLARAWVARSCKSSSARAKRSGSPIGPWGEASRNSRTQDDAGASITGGATVTLGLTSFRSLDDLGAPLDGWPCVLRASALGRLTTQEQDDR